MDLKVEQLIDKLYKVALLRNMSTDNPIKITLENPNVFGYTIVVVAIREPFQYPLPANVLWLCADANSQDFKVLLKRTSKSPSAVDPQNREHSWDRVLYFADVFNPAQYYDTVDQTPDDILHQQFVAHMDNADNPHGVTADQANALPLTGGTLTGPLYLSRDPVDPTEASRKNYIDNRLTSTIGDISRLDSAVINLQVDLDGLNTSLTVLELGFNSYTTSPARTSGYHFTKDVASTSWNIIHNLNSKKISISVFDDTDEQVLPDKIKKNDNSVTITFLTAIKGSVEIILIGA